MTYREWDEAPLLCLDIFAFTHSQNACVCSFGFQNANPEGVAVAPWRQMIR
jgi:hypothetical protein